MFPARFSRVQSRIMRLSRYFLPILKETPKEAEIVSHRLMLRAGMIRQEAAGSLRLAAAGRAGPAQDLRHHPRGAGPRRRNRGAHADRPIGRSLARIRALRRLWQGDAAHPRPARARHVVRPDQRGDDHRDLPRLGTLLQGSAAQSLSHPVEVPRRSPPPLWRHALARISDEGRLHLRSRSGGRAQFLQQGCSPPICVLSRGSASPPFRCAPNPARSAATFPTNSSFSPRPARARSSATATISSSRRRERHRLRRPEDHAGGGRQVDLALCRDIRQDTTPPPSSGSTRRTGFPPAASRSAIFSTSGPSIPRR